MAAQFCGKWKLTKSSDSNEYYKAIGFGDKELAEYAYMDDPKNDVINEIDINGDTIVFILNIGGKEIYKETFTLGKERVVDFEGKKYKCMTKLEGNKLVDIAERDDLKPQKHWRTVSGNTMYLETAEEGGIVAKREMTKV